MGFFLLIGFGVMIVPILIALVVGPSDGSGFLIEIAFVTIAVYGTFAWLFWFAGQYAGAMSGTGRPEGYRHLLFALGPAFAAAFFYLCLAGIVRKRG